jgi:hypothetical protein
MTPDRGDILHLQFDPSSGREMSSESLFFAIPEMGSPPISGAKN